MTSLSGSALLPSVDYRGETLSPPALFGRVQKFPRYRAQLGLDAQLPLDRGPSLVHALNLSEGGAFLRCLRFVAPGTGLRLRLTLQREPVAILARVVHVLEEEPAGRLGREPGLGVTFERLSPRARALLGLEIAALHRDWVERYGAPEGPMPGPRAVLA